MVEELDTAAATVRAVQIRRATEADWPAMWRFMAPVVAAGRTYTYPQDWTSDQAREGWLRLPGWTVLVAEGEDRLLGTVKFGPNFEGRGSHVANASFIVDPDVSGQGVGRALAQYALSAAHERGFRAMQFNAVVASNQPAIRLWRSLGFEILATVPEAFDHPEHGLVGLHIMHRML